MILLIARYSSYNKQILVFIFNSQKIIYLVEPLCISIQFKPRSISTMKRPSKYLDFLIFSKSTICRQAEKLTQNVRLWVHWAQINIQKQLIINSPEHYYFLWHGCRGDIRGDREFDKTVFKNRISEKRSHFIALPAIIHNKGGERRWRKKESGS